MAERPENLRQYVRDAVAEGDEYATPYAWVLEDGGTMYYTCKNCTRVFDGHHAFAGHCGSSAGCGVPAGERRHSASSIIEGVLARNRAQLRTREPHAQRQVPHRKPELKLKPEPEPEPARRWWWPW